MSRLTATIQRRDGRVIPLGPAEKAGSIGMDINLRGTMPGGQTSASLTVARDPDLRDLDPYDELVIRDAGGVEVWSGYGVEYPARDDSGPSIEINASGWSAYLKDNPPPALLGVDRRFDAWHEPPASRKSVSLSFVANFNDRILADSSGGGLSFLGPSGETLIQWSWSELDYEAPAGALVSRVDYKGTQVNATAIAAPAIAYGSDEAFFSGTGTVAATLNDTVQSAVIPSRRFLHVSAQATAASTPAVGSQFLRRWSQIAVYGDHGIPLLDNADDGMKGLLASDVIAWGLRRACPMLIPEISPSTFVIPQLVETSLEDMEALILKVNATEMFDWGCFGRRFVYRPPDSGRIWIVRAADPGVTLNDAGTQGEDLYTRAIVSYSDFGGRSLKAGYPGSGVDTESSLLVDTTNNLLTQKDRPRTLQLSLTAPSTANRAIQVGQVALQEKARMNLRGEATLTGEAQDSNGVWRSVAQIQAGDRIIFADRDWITRRIVDLNYSDATDTCSISLDSTPARLDAILERMGVINESQNL